LIMKMQKKEKKIVCFCLIFSKNTSKWSDPWGDIHQLWRVGEGVPSTIIVIAEGPVKGLPLNLRVRRGGSLKILHDIMVLLGSA
jgi:hypothetical protein